MNYPNSVSLKKNIILFGLGIAYYTCPISNCLAITVPQNNAPGVLLQEQQNNQTLKKPIQTIPEEKPIDIEGIEKIETKKTTPENATEQTSILVKKVEVTGNTKISNLEIKKITLKYEGQFLSFAKLSEIKDKITEKYHSAGYVTSQAYYPPQDITDGTLRIQISEGKVGAINVNESPFFKKRFILPRFSLKQDDVFNINKLKQSLFLINNGNNDVRVQSELSPSSSSGKTDIKLSLNQLAMPYHANYSFSNLGRRLTGNAQNYFGIKSTNLLGFGDQYSGNFGITARSKTILNRYEFPIGHYGTILGFDQAWNEYKLGYEYQPLHVNGQSTSYTPYIIQPLISRQKLQLSADLAFDFKQQYSNELGSDLTQQQIRQLRPGINLTEFDRFGYTFIRQELGLGLDLFGSGSYSTTTSKVSVPGTKFFRYSGYVTRVQPLFRNLTTIVKLNYQVTPDHIASSEQFQLGGAYTVRGYREGQYIGDTGFLTSVELRAPLFLLPKKWQTKFTERYLRPAQILTFIDFGATYAKSGYNGSPSEYALGTGIGVRIPISQKVSLRFDLGFPLLRAEPYSNRPRLHFGLEFTPF